MNRKMSCGYRIAPTIVLALYALCTICPGRYFPAVMDPQQMAAERSHDDCNKGETRRPSECYGLPSQNLNSATEKILPDFTVQVVLASPRDVPINRKHAQTPKALILTSSGPPGLLNARLRI
jgi:hypothetical protein